MIKDVTIIKNEKITLKIRWQGGAHTIMEIPIPLPAPLERSTPKEAIDRIRELSKTLTAKQVVEHLNREGYITGTRQPFDVNRLHQITAAYGIKNYYDHLREEGKLTTGEMAERLGICAGTVIKWCRAGLLRGYVVNDKGEYLLDPPPDIKPVKRRGEKLETRRRNLENCLHSLNGV